MSFHVFFKMKIKSHQNKKLKMLKRPTSNGFWFYMIFFIFQSVTGTAIKIKKKGDENEKNFLN